MIWLQPPQDYHTGNGLHCRYCKYNFMAFFFFFFFFSSEKYCIFLISPQKWGASDDFQNMFSAKFKYHLYTPSYLELSNLVPYLTWSRGYKNVCLF